MNLTESRLGELWDLARSDDASINDLSSDESLVLHQFRTIHKSLRLSWHSATSKALELAKAIMPRTERKFSIGRLILPKPLLGFARGAVSQVQFESEEIQVRIQIEEIPNGWRMWGRTSEPGWIVWSGESSATCNKYGEFELDVTAESIEPLSLQNESTTVLLPMALNEHGDGSK